MEVPLLQPQNRNPSPDNNPYNNYYDDPQQQNDPIQEQQTSTHLDANFSFGHSPLSNLALLFFYFAKIVYSIYVCITAGSSCISFVTYWVFGMLVHDMMAMSIPSKRIQNTAALKRINSNPDRPEDINEEYIQNHLNQDLEATNLEQRIQAQQQLQYRLEDELNAYRDTLSILKRTKEIQKLSDLSICLWMILVFGGLYHQVFKVKDSCSNPEMSKLMDLYLAMALGWLLRHLILVILGCLCLPVLLILVWIFGSGPKKASNAAIKKLPVKPYKSDFPGDKECAICMVEYEENDKVVMLACNPMHYFHEDCGKKWLGINGQCPICRARVDGKKEEPNRNNNNN